jgi:hypothetical protein
MPESPSLSRQDWRKIVPGVIISALALVAIFYLVDLRRLVDALLLADYRFIILLLAITVLCRGVVVSPGGHCSRSVRLWEWFSYTKWARLNNIHHYAWAILAKRYIAGKPISFCRLPRSDRADV